MRPHIRYALVVVSVIAASVTTIGPALAATGPWVEETPAPFATVIAFVPGALAGHEGNLHTFAVDVDGDDDGVNGGLSDWQCPEPVTGWSDACTQVAGWDFWEDGRVVVTWSAGVKYMQVIGPITLESEWTGELIQSQMNVRIHATGELTRTKSVTHYKFPSDSWDTKVVDASRDSVTFSGRMAWLKTTNSPSNSNWPLRVVRTFNRGLGDGV
jgi:hypothetical protein